jgi:S-DNA-T family DNA segregation ATPase FtsK/SpoIIIE
VISTNEEIKEEPIVEPLAENIPLELEVNTQPEELKKDLDFEVNNPGADEILKEPEFVKEEPKENQITLDDELKASQLVEKFGQYDPTLDLGHYQFPSVELLIDYGTGNAKVSNEELTANKDRIVSTLKNYGIEIDKISAIVGPTVTLYEIVPAPGVRISKIKNLEDDIALSLAALRYSYHCSYSREKERLVLKFQIKILKWFQCVISLLLRNFKTPHTIYQLL